MSRAGDLGLRALAVSLLASVPTALRTAGAGGSFPGGLLVGAGVLVPVVGLSLWLSRASGRGFRQLIRAEGPRAAVLGLSLWIGIALPLLVVLGAGLKATTHHRGIAGATFGVLALVIVAAAALLAQRLVSLGRRLVERGLKPWIPAAIGAAVGVLPLLALAAPLGRAGGDEAAAAVRAAISDSAIVLVATALAASLDLSARLRKASGAFGVPAAAVIVLGAMLRIESSPELGRAIKAGGGLPATLLGALERWTDRDGDGVGAHFGGDDCDEGDPSRHPGAPEIPGDGIDQDCDGIDPPKPVAVAETAAPEPKGGPTVPAALVLPVDPAKPWANKPDILLITLDTVRADHTSAYGYDKATTPHLAELASRGTLFDHAYATGSDTRRAMMPVVSGKRLADTPHDAREWPTILPEADTMAERLKRAGYRTGAVTSFTWLSDERGFSQGFDYWKPVFKEAHPERESTGPLALKAALGIWKELEKDPHPIFLWVHLFDAHERYLEHPGIKLGKGKIGLYDGEVAFVDQQVGELISAVEASPRAARAAWIVHGSQGEALGEHDTNGHGNDVYDEVLRVPLVVALPGGKPGRYSDGAVSILDVAPTLIELSGAEGEGVAGASLLPIVRGDFARKHGPVYARTQKKAALIDWPLKLMVMERRKADRILLFDLAKDPGEKEDVSADRAADVTRLVEERSKLEEK